MPKNILKTLLLINFSFLLFLPFSFAHSESLSAAEIMKKVDERYTGDTQHSKSTLILIDKRGRERNRDLRLFSMETYDVDKSLIYFMSPSDVKGTAYMSFDWREIEKEDDTWLYLPAMQKIKRVASSEESGAFMGSDFSYSDINGQDYEDYNYSLEKESEYVGEHDCWVIRSTPKDNDIIKKTGYTGSTSWIRKDIYMSVKSIIDVKKGKRTKYFAVKDIEKIQNVWTAKTLQMVTTRNKKKEHSSVFVITDIEYNKDVDAAMFDTQAMLRGL